MGILGQTEPGTGSPSATILQKLRRGLIGLGLLSGFMQCIILGGALFLMMMFDIILPGRSTASLVGVFMLAVGAVLFLGGFSILRSRMLIDLSAMVQADLSPGMPGAIQYVAVNGGGAGDGQQPLDDLEDVRAFLASSGAAALLDLPWSLLALLMLFLFHVWLGAVALVALIVVGILCFALESGSARPLGWLAEGRSYRRLVADEQRRQVDAVHGLGMRARFGARWLGLDRRVADMRRQQERTSVTIAVASGAFRLIFFILMLTVGIALAFNDRASVGVVVAAAILLFQILLPADRAIEAWPDFVAARLAWRRLSKLMPLLDRGMVSTLLPPPVEALELGQVAITAPGRTNVLVQGVGFRLKAGQALAVVGHSGAGKSVLLRAIVGLWRPAHGVIRLDGATLDQWESDILGSHIGYLPQTNELLIGTVGQNIARFDFEARSDEIIAAAEAAGVHEQILRLPDGYETEVGRDGKSVPPGLRQRIALARALFRDPFLVVLDDPHSSLDVEGDAALVKAIAKIRARNGIVIIVAYRTNILPLMDHILVMRQGTMAAFGPPDNILPRLLGQDKPTEPAKEDAPQN